MGELDLSGCPQIERRMFPARELRTEGEGEARKIVGYAAEFGVRTQLYDDVYEEIAPGAFAESIGQDDIRSLFNHDPNLVLGRNMADTLRLAEDDRGLKIEIDPPDTQLARDLMVLLDRGDVSQMSFGFLTLSDKWEMEDGNQIRTLIKVKLFDVSPATYAAYPTTEVALRNIEGARESLETWEKQQEPPGLPVAVARRRLDLRARQMGA